MSLTLIIDGDAGRLDQFQALLPHARCVHAISPAVAIAGLLEHEAALVYLDHDLGGGARPGGRLVAGWLSEHAEAFAQTTVVLHTLDDTTADAMAAVLTKAGLRVIRKPFAWLDPAFVRATQPHAPSPQQ